MTTYCRVCKKPFEDGMDEGERSGSDPICTRCFVSEAADEADKLEGMEGDPLDHCDN